jgi:hypothetical protein
VIAAIPRTRCASDCHVWRSRLCPSMGSRSAIDHRPPSIVCRIEPSHSDYQKRTISHASASSPSATRKYHPMAARAPNHWESIPIVPAISAQPMAGRQLAAITRLLASGGAVCNKSRSTKTRFLPLAYRNGPREQNDPSNGSAAAGPHSVPVPFLQHSAQIRLGNYTLGVELQFRHHILLISCIPTSSS